MTQPAPPPPPLQASDPARLTDDQIVPRFAPPQVGGGSFRVNLSEAPRVVADLRRTNEDLRSLRNDAVALGNVRPPAPDSVSSDAARVLGATASGGQGSLIEALDAGIRQLGELITALQEDLNNYQNAESTSVVTMRAEGRA